MAEIVARNPNVLLALPIPDISPSQIEAFTLESLLARITGKLGPLHAADILQQNTGRELLVFDIGGTAMKSVIAKVSGDGKVIEDESQERVIESEEKGENYLAELKKTRHDYPNLYTAVSTTGVVDGGSLVACPNLGNFVEQLKKAGGFQTVLGGGDVPVMNDAQAGLIAGAVGVTLKNVREEVSPMAKPVIYIINGGGIGGAVMDKDGILWATEPGHVQLVSVLNPNEVSGSCGLNGRQYTCVEKIGASGAGIEKQWEKKFGQRLDGKLIAERMYHGDEYALNLYNVASTATAHIVAGMMSAMKIIPSEVSVVLHGGFFKTESVIERMKQILNQYYGQDIDLVSAKNLGFSNACIAGAAIAALISNK